MKMNSNIFTSVIGKVLHGFAHQKIRPDTHMGDERFFPNHNSLWTILNKSALCRVQTCCDNCEEYTGVKVKLLTIGVTVKEKAGEKVCGNRIFCEHSKPMDEKPTEGAHGCIMKGKYALATVSKEPKRAGAIYKTTERIIPKTKWEALRKDMH